MANLSIVIVPAKKLSNGRHRVRIAVAHRSQTRYISTQFHFGFCKSNEKWTSSKT